MKAFSRILTVLFIVSMFISAGRAQASTWNLNKAKSQSSGKQTSSIVKADFNGDGIMDIASCTRQNSGKVSIFLGKGDGKFTKKVALDAGSKPVSIVAADFNGDGIMDLAVADFGSDDVMVYLGKGDGTFQDGVSNPVGASPVFIVSADFNGDSNADLAVANWEDNTVTVLFGNGDGTFPTSTSLPTGSRPRSIAVGDIDKTGGVDLVVANWADDTVSFIAGDGLGNFAGKVDFNAGKNPSSVALGDLNGDGWLDIVTTNFDTDNVALLLSNSLATFSGFKPVEFIISGSGPSFVAIKDIDGDGNQDILTCNGAANNLSLFFGFGDGTFQPRKDFTAGSGPISFVISDFNNNGGWDLAVANYNSGSISVFTDKNTKLGDWNFIPGAITSTSLSPSSVFAADLNRDEFTDVVMTDGSKVSILLNDGKGVLVAAAAPLTAGITPVDAVAADFTGDGIKDIAVANNDSLDVTILKGAPDGTYSAIVPSVLIGHSPVSIVNGDFNKDGKMDFAVCNSGTPGSVYVFSGNGDGTFPTVNTYAVGNNPLKIVTGDFNGDGIPDLAVANQGSGTISILMGVASGGFSETTVTLPTGSAPNSLAAADFNADNKTDLAVLSAANKTVLILLSNGNGTFRVLTGTLSTGDSPSSIAAADLNLDKMPDIVVTAADGVSVYFGKGSGVFNTASLIASTTGSGPAVISEFNKDGKADLAVASSAPGVYIIKGIDRFNITTGTTGSGTVSPGTGPYEAGKIQLLKATATPDAGSYFKDWSGNLSGSDNPHQLLINSSSKDKTYTAVFETGPNISSLLNATTSSTNSGIVGEVITITDSQNNFGPAKGTVTVGSISAKIDSWAVGTITFEVPSNIASNKYKLHVTTSDNKKSNEWDFYIPKAFITGITNDALATITSATKGQPVKIHGVNIGLNKLTVTLYPVDGISGTNATVTASDNTSVTDNTVDFTVPSVTTGDYIIKVRNSHGYSNGFPITITSP